MIRNFYIDNLDTFFYDFSNISSGVYIYLRTKSAKCWYSFNAMQSAHFESLIYIY